MEPVRVVSLSSVYPRPAEENLGLFVRNRLQHMSRLLPIKVVSPAAIIDYAARGEKKGPIPPRRQDDNIEVFYPRWIYPPHGGFVDSFLMAAQLAPYLRRLRRGDPLYVLHPPFW